MHGDCTLFDTPAIADICPVILPKIALPKVAASADVFVLGYHFGFITSALSR
jgi:hypothetical protein